MALHSNRHLASELRSFPPHIITHRSIAPVDGRWRELRSTFYKAASTCTPVSIDSQYMSKPGISLSHGRQQSDADMESTTSDDVDECPTVTFIQSQCRMLEARVLNLRSCSPYVRYVRTVEDVQQILLASALLQSDR